MFSYSKYKFHPLYWIVTTNSPNNRENSLHCLMYICKNRIATNLFHHTGDKKMLVYSKLSPFIFYNCKRYRNAYWRFRLDSTCGFLNFPLPKDKYLHLRLGIKFYKTKSNYGYVPILLRNYYSAVWCREYQIRTGDLRIDSALFYHWTNPRY